MEAALITSSGSEAQDDCLLLLQEALVTSLFGGKIKVDTSTTLGFALQNTVTAKIELIVLWLTL